MNVIMVLADQHHAGLMGCAGHEQAKTPHIDRFAKDGVRFSNAYCQNPICTPSRVSILSGQYCHNHGYYGLSGPSNPDLPNAMGYFKKAGYRTAGYGKLHLPSTPRSWIANDVDSFGDTYETADGELGKSEFLDELSRLGLRDLEDSWHNKNHYGDSPIASDSMVSELPYKHTQEVWSIRKALEFIDQSLDDPFFVQVSFQKPHHPLLPQQQFWDLYPEDLELPPTFEQPPDHRPPHFQKEWHKFREHQWEYADSDNFKAGAQRMWRGTLACVSQVDDVFGMLLNGLDERSLADNTIVIYGSDHGCYHGIHGLPEKAPGICSDAVCRVPMIWRIPGVEKTNTTITSLVENIDYLPTLASLCAIGEPDWTDGSDLTPLIHEKAESVKDVAVTENPWSRSIRWKQWRYVHYPEGTFDSGYAGELYDIEADPHEITNLFNSVEHQTVIQECRLLLLDWLAKTLRIRSIHPPLLQKKDPMDQRRYELAADNKISQKQMPNNRPLKTPNYL
jgi:arylsulfatase A-like enzyme